MASTDSATIPQYIDLKSAIHATCQIWCQANGYTDPFCRHGEWWAFPPHSVLPVQIKTVIDADSYYPVKIGPISLTIWPDGTLASAIE